MKFKPLIAAALVAVVAVTPLSPAFAYGRGYGHDYGHDHFHGGPLLLPFIAVGAVLTGVAIVATAPFRAVADAADYNDGPRYAPPRPVYAAPQPVYYSSAPAYYAPPPRYYPAPQAYYAGPRGYYAYQN